MVLFLQTIGIGQALIEGIAILQGVTKTAIGLTIGVVVTLLLMRLLAEGLRLNPFGSLYQTMRRPTDRVIAHLRTSRFYSPLRQSLGFDPSVLMVLLALAILWYVLTGVMQNLFFLLQGLGLSLISLGRGDLLVGAKYLIGVGLLAILFFLMAMMTVIFVNWIFGLFRRLAWRALDRLTPLLRLFEFGGIFTGWSFLILWIAVSFAAQAVQAIFF
jgi:hypothetical protein